MNANAHTPAIDESLLAVAPTEIAPTLVHKRGVRSCSSPASSCADVETPNLDRRRLVINADGDVIRYVIQLRSFSAHRISSTMFIMNELRVLYDKGYHWATCGARRIDHWRIVSSSGVADAGPPTTIGVLQSIRTAQVGAPVRTRAFACLA